MIQLEFKTEKQLQSPYIISIKWVLLNEEIADQCYHEMDFIIDNKSFDEIIAEYEATAKQQIFNVINNKFPNLYTL